MILAWMEGQTAVGGFEAEDTTERRGDADGTAAVTAQTNRDEAGGHSITRT